MTGAVRLEHLPLWKGSVCNHCRQPNTESMCHICRAAARDRAYALVLARDWNFECGPFCRFCESDEDTAPCQSTSMEMVFMTVADLVEGDTMAFLYDPRRRLYLCEINDRFDDYRELKFKSVGSRSRAPGDLWGNSIKVQALRPGLCRTMACWRHRRELIEDPKEGQHAICMDHWRSWDTALAG